MLVGVAWAWAWAGLDRTEQTFLAIIKIMVCLLLTLVCDSRRSLDVCVGFRHRHNRRALATLLPVLCVRLQPYRVAISVKSLKF